MSLWNQAKKHPNGSRCDRCSIENPPWEIKRILRISAAETTVKIQPKKTGPLTRNSELKKWHEESSSVFRLYRHDLCKEIDTRQIWYFLITFIFSEIEMVVSESCIKTEHKPKNSRMHLPEHFSTSEPKSLGYGHKITKNFADVHVGSLLTYTITSFLLSWWGAPAITQASHLAITRRLCFRKALFIFGLWCLNATSEWNKAGMKWRFLHHKTMASQNGFRFAVNIIFLNLSFTIAQIFHLRHSWLNFP